MTGIKKINLISAVLVSLSLCGGCTLEKAGNSSQDQTVQEDNETEPVSYTHLTLPTICSV